MKGKRSESRSVTRRSTRNRSRSSSINRSSRKSRHRSHSRSRSNSREKRKDTESSTDENKNVENISKSNDDSCTIEETNRIRLSLGLKPLNIGKSKEDEINERSDKLRIAQEQAARQAEILARIKRSKNKRELHSKLKGKSLGDMLIEEAEKTGSSASDWVKKSRSKEESLKAIEEAKKLAKKLEAQDDLEKAYSAEDLAGMKVIHSAAEFEEGQQIILTLRDQKVLDEEASEELENVNMSEMDRLKKRKAMEKKVKQPLYSGYDDDEFDTNSAFKKTNILSQYDEEEKKPSAKLTLNAYGGASKQLITKSDDNLATKEKMKVSLLMDEPREMNDYYTPQEMVAFKKPKKKRRKKLRKIGADIDEEEVNGMNTISKLQVLSKEQIEQKEQGDVTMEDVSSKDILGVPVIKTEATAPSKDKSFQFMDTIEDVDADLRNALAQSRRMAVLKKQQKAASRAAEIASIIELQNKKEPKVKTEIVSDSTIVFSDNTDFETRLRTALEDKERAKLEAIETENRRARYAEEEQKHSAMDIEDNIKVEPSMDESVSPDAEDDWSVQQPLVSSGMGATLALLQSTGDLRNREVPRQAGRANDRRTTTSSFLKDRVKIEYKDEFGRIVTPKEAFRLQSYRFHGQKPGKKKMEQRLKTLKEELKMEKMLSGEGSLATMKALERQQKQSGQAFVMLSGKTQNTK